MTIIYSVYDIPSSNHMGTDENATTPILKQTEPILQLFLQCLYVK